MYKYYYIFICIIKLFPLLYINIHFLDLFKFKKQRYSIFKVHILYNNANNLCFNYTLSIYFLQYFFIIFYVFSISFLHFSCFCFVFFYFIIYFYLIIEKIFILLRICSIYADSILVIELFCNIILLIFFYGVTLCKITWKLENVLEVYVKTYI